MQLRSLLEVNIEGGKKRFKWSFAGRCDTRRFCQMEKWKISSSPESRKWFWRRQKQKTLFEPPKQKAKKSSRVVSRKFFRSANLIGQKVLRKIFSLSLPIAAAKINKNYVQAIKTSVRAKREVRWIMKSGGIMDWQEDLVNVFFMKCLAQHAAPLDV